MRTKTILASLLAVVVAVALAGAGTLALFTAETGSTGNTFTAGTLDIDVTAPGTWSADYSNMAPGDVVTKTLTLKNTGNLELKFAPKIPVTSGALFSGTGKALVSITYDDPVLLPDETEDVVIAVELPLTAGNAYQNTTGDLSLTFLALQTKNLVAQTATSHLLSTADPTWNKYEFRDENGVLINLVPANVLVFTETKPTGQIRTFELIPGDPYFWFSKNRPAGEYTYEIIGVNGQQYTATIHHTTP